VPDVKSLSEKSRSGCETPRPQVEHGDAEPWLGGDGQRSSARAGKTRRRGGGVDHLAGACAMGPAP
jgi:hypothetical protein